MRPLVAAVLGVALGSSATLLCIRSFAADPAKDRVACEPGSESAGKAAGRQRIDGRAADRLALAGRDQAAARGASRERTLAHEVSDLNSYVDDLHTALAHAEQEQVDSKTYDLSAEKLMDMAARCELRWDMPSLEPLPPSVTPETIQALGLTDAERTGADEILSAFHKRLLDAVTKTYAQIGNGDPAKTGISGLAMFEEIVGKADRTELQTIFQRLSRERAGIAEPPGQPPASPVEALLRTMTSVGDELETKLGEKLGSARARKLRDVNHGWDSQHKSSYGCPS